MMWSARVRIIGSSSSSAKKSAPCLRLHTGHRRHMAQPKSASRAARFHPFGSSSRPIQRLSPAEESMGKLAAKAKAAKNLLETRNLPKYWQLHLLELRSHRDARPGCGQKLRAERPCSTPFVSFSSEHERHELWGALASVSQRGKCCSASIAARRTSPEMEATCARTCRSTSSHQYLCFR